MFHVEREGTMPRVIAVANQKGGVGKTTTALNVSAALALAGKRCLLVDLDPQGNATTGLGMEKKRREGAYLLLADHSKAAAAIVPSGVKNLDVVPSSPNLGEAEAQLASQPNRHLRLKLAKPQFEKAYDFVFIDCPPGTGFFPANALACAESVLIPIQCEYFAMEGLTQILSNISAMRNGSNPQLEVESILLTMYEPSAFAREVVTEVRSHFSDLVCDTVIPRDITLAEAPSHGQSIIDYAPRSRGARAYLELAKEILNDHQG